MGTDARLPLATTITTAKTQTTATTTAEIADLADVTRNRTAIRRSRRITDRGRAIATNNPDIKYALAVIPSYSECARANLRLYSNNNEDIPNHPQAAIHEEAQAGSAKAAVQEAEAQAEGHQEQPCKPTIDAKTATEAAIATEATEATATVPGGTARARANHPRTKTTTATTICPTIRR